LCLTSSIVEALRPIEAYYVLSPPIKVRWSNWIADGLCDAAHIIRWLEFVSLTPSGGHQLNPARTTKTRLLVGDPEKERQMKKAALILATVATLAAAASAPAEARGLRGGAAIAAAAVAAAVVADSYGYGYGPGYGSYYYGAAPVYYGGPVYYRGYHRGWRHYS
jgi:hypothetical protein